VNLLRLELEFSDILYSDSQFKNSANPKPPDAGWLKEEEGHHESTRLKLLYAKGHLAQSDLF